MKRTVFNVPKIACQLHSQSYHFRSKVQSFVIYKFKKMNLLFIRI